MKKRMLAFLIAVSLCLLWVPVNPARAETSKDGLWSYDKWNKTILRYYGDAEDLTIPKSIDGWQMSVIGVGAFVDCTSLKTVKLSSYIKKIEKGGFGRCSNLKSVKGGADKVAIGDDAFLECTSLKTIDINIAPEEIGYRAFQNCTSLESFAFPADMKKVNDNAFKGCTSLKTIQLPKYINLGVGVFAGCTSLDGIWAHPDSNSKCNDEYGVLFNKDKTELLEAPGGLTGTYVVPDTVERISRYAFYGCDKLETIIIPDTVKDMGIESFQYCTSLHTAVLSGYVGTTRAQFKGCTALETVVINRSCGNNTFADCSSLKSVYCYSARTDHSPISFLNVTANMYYVESKAKLPLEELQPYQFGGNITWVPLDGYCVAKGDGSTYAVGSDIGAIFLVMAPWGKLVSVSVDGSVLTEEQYLPMTKGTSIILKDDYLKTLALGEHTLTVKYADGSCDATFTLTDKIECKHNVVTQKAKAPTCTKSGLTEGSYCTKCGEVFVEQQKIAKLGHDYEVTTVAPTCLEGGYDLYQCTRCDKTKQDNETESLGPKFGEWETIKEPTVEEEGLEVRRCGNCEAMEERPVEKLAPPPTQPPTEPPTEPAPTEPVPTEPVPTEPAPTQPPTTAPAETQPAPTEPDTQMGGEPVNLVPFIIVGAVLLVAGAVVMLYLLRRKS